MAMNLIAPSMSQTQVTNSSELAINKRCTMKEFAKIMSEHYDMSPKNTNKAITAFLYSIRQVISQGKNITFSGFGTFKVFNRPARTFNHCVTGEKLEIPESNTVRFIIDDRLKKDLVKNTQ
jgi:DNA-binding protein HU-beta